MSTASRYIRPRAFTVRYRVVSRLYESDRAVIGHVREFKTLKGAEVYRDSLVGDTVIQVGVLQWLDDETAYAEICRLQHEGLRRMN